MMAHVPKATATVARFTNTVRDIAAVRARPASLCIPRLPRLAYPRQRQHNLIRSTKLLYGARSARGRLERYSSPPAPRSANPAATAGRATTVHACGLGHVRPRGPKNAPAPLAFAAKTSAMLVAKGLSQNNRIAD